MAIITRGMVEYLRVATSNAGRPPWPTTHAISFEETPCTLDEANAHLEMLSPSGIVVLARPRGPKGGWGVLRFISKRITLRITFRHTLHIGYRAEPATEKIYGQGLR
jgi:hypothetical protein